MFIQKGKYTMKQMAYARQLLGAQGKNKKQIALDVGYSSSVANSVAQHIESQQGFNNAMMKLAHESNNLALAAMHEFQSRGFSEFTNTELTNALNAIAGAWAKFNTASPLERSNDTSKNRLRTIILQRVENQTVTPSQQEEKGVEAVEATEEEIQEFLEADAEAQPEPNEDINDDPNDF